MAARARGGCCAPTWNGTGISAQTVSGIFLRENRRVLPMWPGGVLQPAETPGAKGDVKPAPHIICVALGEINAVAWTN